MRDEFEKAVSLRVIDTHWMEHINTMSHLREGIHLRGYAQENPLRAYTSEGFELFDNLLATIDKDTTFYLMKAEVRQNTERKQVAKGEAVTDSNKEKKRKSLASFITNLVIGIIFSILALIFLIIIFQYYFMDSDPSIYLSVKVIVYFFIVSVTPATIAVSNLVMRIIRNKDKRDGKEENEPTDLSNISCEWNKDTFFLKN